MNTENASHSPWLPMAGTIRYRATTKTLKDIAMPLRISAVQVAPMKIPSNWKLQTEITGNTIELNGDRRGIMVVAEPDLSVNGETGSIDIIIDNNDIDELSNPSRWRSLVRKLKREPSL